MSVSSSSPLLPLNPLLPLDMLESTRARAPPVFLPTPFPPPKGDLSSQHSRDPSGEFGNCALRGEEKGDVVDRFPGVRGGLPPQPAAFRWVLITGSATAEGQGFLSPTVSLLCGSVLFLSKTAAAPSSSSEAFIICKGSRCRYEGISTPPSPWRAAGGGCRSGKPPQTRQGPPGTEGW